MMSKEQVFLEEKTDSGELKILENPSILLRKFGLSANQSKIYLGLSKLGPKTASDLSNILDIPRTETYHILKTLQSKGCVSTIHQKPLKFDAVSIEEFFETVINLEKAKMKKLEDTLELVKKLKTSKHNFEFEKSINI